MLSNLPTREPDGIMRILAMFRDDARPEKIDLGVGVYRTEEGTTPIFRAVKAAEARILSEQDTKGYTALTGDAAFTDAMADLVLGPSRPASLAMAGTPGGTGAVRQALELVKLARPDATVWISAPTWPNHPAMIRAVGLNARTYRYFDAEACALDRDGMMEDLSAIAPGDVVLLHGCCHNPTGVDPSAQDWKALAQLLSEKGALPFIDVAYQGFGAGLEQDAAGLRHLVDTLPEVILTISASKNFGLYRERVGVVIAACPDATAQAKAQAALASLNREAFAFPPDHGARAVTTILTDPALRADWETELAEMRTRVTQNRAALATALQQQTGSDRFGYLAAGRGMFSLLPASAAQVDQMRDTNALYMIPDGRINLAGLTAPSIATAARIIGETLA